MAENIVIGDENAENEPIADETYVEYTSEMEYIQAAYYAFDMSINIDTALLNKSDERRVQRMRRQSLRIVSECLNDLYNEIFDDEKTDN
jgi:hypothetical protein